MRREDSSYATTANLRPNTLFGSLFPRGTACSTHLLLPLAGSTPSREKGPWTDYKWHNHNQAATVFCHDVFIPRAQSELSYTNLLGDFKSSCLFLFHLSFQRVPEEYLFFLWNLLSLS